MNLIKVCFRYDLLGCPCLSCDGTYRELLPTWETERVICGSCGDRVNRWLTKKQFMAHCAFLNEHSDEEIDVDDQLS